MKAHRRILEKENGETVEISFPAPFPRKSFFAFSLFKAGSTLMHKMLAEYCTGNKVPVVDIPSCLFRAGVRVNSISPASMDSVLLEDGYGYLGWRAPPHRVQFDFGKTKNVLLVRDPRDRVVSMYFSWAYSHVVPQSGEARANLRTMREKVLRFGNVNELVLGDSQAVRAIITPLNRFHRMLPGDTTRLYRYEDVIYRKKEWLRDMLEFLGIDIDQQLVDKVAENNDLRPESEQHDAHVRQVAPGNYKKHISEKALGYLNDVCSDYIRAYGYDNEDSFAKKLVYAREGREAALVLRPFRNFSKVMAQLDNTIEGKG